MIPLWQYLAFVAWFNPTEDELEAREIAADAARKAGER